MEISKKEGVYSPMVIVYSLKSSMKHYKDRFYQVEVWGNDQKWAYTLSGNVNFPLLGTQNFTKGLICLTILRRKPGLLRICKRLPRSYEYVQEHALDAEGCDPEDLGWIFDLEASKNGFSNRHIQSSGHEAFLF
ncbi:unnamed protein product [Lupinus luteus]|uniref:Uncharacterized protein n=1 Tax=Lupinus luteus TaxID=3873 RepID=A0AAV1W174_LUPLU